MKTNRLYTWLIVTAILLSITHFYSINDTYLSNRMDSSESDLEKRSSFISHHSENQLLFPSQSNHSDSDSQAVTNSANETPDGKNKDGSTKDSPPIIAIDLESESSLTSYVVSSNISNNALVRSYEYVNFSFSPSVPALEYIIGDITNDPYINTNQTNLSHLTLAFSDLLTGELSREIEILLNILNSSNETEQIEYFSFTLDDNWVKIISINEDETKIVGVRKLSLNSILIHVQSLIV